MVPLQKIDGIWNIRSGIEWSCVVAIALLYLNLNCLTDLTCSGMQLRPNATAFVSGTRGLIYPMWQLCELHGLGINIVELCPEPQS